MNSTADQWASVDFISKWESPVVLSGLCWPLRLGDFRSCGPKADAVGRKDTIG